jgi:hypothetical protein
MALIARNRSTSVDILQIDFEYCTISCFTECTRNDLGEPAHDLVQRATNVKCSIDPLSRISIRQRGLRDILPQGIIERSLFVMTLYAEQAIEPGDLVTDYDGISYDVLHVLNWHTHKEAFLRKMN